MADPPAQAGVPSPRQPFQSNEWTPAGPNRVPALSAAATGSYARAVRPAPSSADDVPGDPAAPVTVRVPAKVNLSLAVGDARPDGFHDLVTVFHAVSLFDDLVVAPADGLSLAVRGRDAGQVPADERNLAWRAAVLLAGRLGRSPDVRIEITKDIPVAGGMAGGSADAAAALVGCARLWGVRDRELLLSVAAELGSDVAFPLLGGTAVGTGRGERLRPVPCAARLHWVFAFADFGISAGDAYRELDRQRAGGLPARSPDTEALLAARGEAVAGFQAFG